MLYKTEGIILKSTEFQDADKIVTIFSKNYGKIRAIAKGVRKTKSKFGSSMEILTCAFFLISKGRNLDIISQTEIVDSFFQTSKELEKYAFAINCTEVINKLTEDREINIELYFLFKELLCYLKDAKDPKLLALSFKWKVLQAIGYQPSLYRCFKCNKIIEGEKEAFFRIADGGITCNKCVRQDKSDYIRITDYFIRLLRKILTASLSSISKAAIPKIRIQELEYVTDIYMTYYSNNIFKTERFLKNF